MTEPVALFHGCWSRQRMGHFLYGTTGRTIYEPRREFPGFPWDAGLMDNGLLVNGKHPDVVDGKVWRTCGGDPLWHAFYWWDRSGDARGNSNSGFYVRGYAIGEHAAAFGFACDAFADIVARQPVPLVLQL